MVRQADTEFISSSTTLSDNNEVYMINAGNSNLTITLPTITSDGSNYKLVRQDKSDNIVTVEPSGSNLLISNLGISGTTGSGVTGNINLLPSGRLSVQSFDDNWHVTENGTNDFIASKCIFSSSYDRNPGNPLSFRGGNGGGRTTTLTIIPYMGYNLSPISYCNFIASTTSGTTGYLEIQNGPDTLSTINVTSSVTPIMFSTTTFANVPLTNSPLTIIVRVSGTSSNRINMYSLVIG